MFQKNEIVEIAELILETIVSTYQEHETDLPARRYLAVGGQASTVWDCEQVTVSWEQGYSGLPGNQAQTPVKCNSPRSAVFVVEVVRQVPLPNTSAAVAETVRPSRYGTNTTINSLPPEAHTEMAKRQMVDGMLLMEAGLKAGETTLTGSIVDVSAGTEQGGYQAVIMTVVASAVTPVS